MRSTHVLPSYWETFLWMMTWNSWQGCKVNAFYVCKSVFAWQKQYQLVPLFFPIRNTSTYILPPEIWCTVKIKKKPKRYCHVKAHRRGQPYCKQILYFIAIECPPSFIQHFIFFTYYIASADLKEPWTKLIEYIVVVCRPGWNNVLLVLWTACFHGAAQFLACYYRRCVQWGQDKDSWNNRYFFCNLSLSIAASINGRPYITFLEIYRLYLFIYCLDIRNTWWG